MNHSPIIPPRVVALIVGALLAGPALAMTSPSSPADRIGGTSEAFPCGGYAQPVVCPAGSPAATTAGVTPAGADLGPFPCGGYAQPVVCPTGTAGRK